MAEEAPSSNGHDNTALDGDGTKATSNGAGILLKFDGALKRKRPVDLVSNRYEADQTPVTAMCYVIDIAL